MLRRNAYILVFSSTVARVAQLDHSWYHSLNRRAPMWSECILDEASSSVSAGMKCVLKVALKFAHVPKSTGVRARAVLWQSRAHSPAGVPCLKYVSTAAIFLFTSGYSVSFR